MGPLGDQKPCVLTATRQLDDLKKNAAMSHYCVMAHCAVSGRSLGGDSEAEGSSALILCSSLSRSSFLRS